MENSDFQGGRYITSIKLPYTLKTIGWWAFMECSSLTAIDLPESLETVSDGAFAMCSALK
ncbi:MAG: leucine-rich repeat protein [Bacteroidales bacterium]|nr:leucine-rich repeat protein [Bacteroidales bacterium]